MLLRVYFLRKIPELRKFKIQLAVDNSFQEISIHSHGSGDTLRRNLSKVIEQAFCIIHIAEVIRLCELEKQSMTFHLSNKCLIRDCVNKVSRCFSLLQFFGLSFEFYLPIFFQFPVCKCPSALSWLNCSSSVSTGCLWCFFHWKLYL